MVLHINILSWALIFILRLPFPAGKSIATILSLLIIFSCCSLFEFLFCIYMYFCLFLVIYVFIVIYRTHINSSFYNWIGYPVKICYNNKKSKPRFSFYFKKFGLHDLVPLGVVFQASNQMRRIKFDVWTETCHFRRIFIALNSTQLRRLN